MAPKGKIPDRWIPYKACGDVIEGTRIICFKVPISKRVQENVPEIKQIWDVAAVLAEIPKLGAVIDLTNTARYYDPREFEQANVRHRKILMPGREIPPESKVQEFMDAVDEFLGKDRDSLVGVHCTHGLNRTGYMVCRYMRDRLKIPADVAIARFEKARGYEMERENYKADLLDSKRARRDTNLKQRPKKSREIAMDLYENPFFDPADDAVNSFDSDISISEDSDAESMVTAQKLTQTQKKNVRLRMKRKEKKAIREKIELEKPKPETSQNTNECSENRDNISKKKRKRKKKNSKSDMNEGASDPKTKKK